MPAADAAAGGPPPMRVFHIVGERVDELDAVPQALPDRGFIWMAWQRRALEADFGVAQAALVRLTGAQLFEPHVSDLLNRQLPSNFDTTSDYDLLVFRRLTVSAGSDKLIADAEAAMTMQTARAALRAVDTSAVGFAVFDRVLLTVHPLDCRVRDHFAQRLVGQGGSGVEAAAEGRAGRLPPSPAELTVRMVNHMVDGYLELRRLLSRQIDFLQQELLDPRARFADWGVLVEARNTLHLLEDICEDQRAAIVEWIDSLGEWPEAHDPERRKSHEQLRVRSRDVLEHIERVLTHVRRLEAQAEASVQMHFSAQSNRTNETMRTLTTLTAIFLPLNLVTGFFGMNFDGLPLIHSRTGFWVVFGLILALGIGASVFFWRRRYLSRL